MTTSGGSTARSRGSSTAGPTTAFDTRTHGPTGDAAIIPFDENLTELKAAPKASKVTPFGDWLFARVTKLATLAERNIRDLA